MRKGQALLEGTLALLGLVLAITLILDVAQAFLFTEYFTERARAGARYAAVNEYDPKTVANFVVYNNPRGAVEGASALMGLQPHNVVVERLDMGSTGDRIEVSIHDFSLRSFTPFLSRAYHPLPFKAVFPVESLGAAN